MRWQIPQWVVGTSADVSVVVYSLVGGRSALSKSPSGTAGGERIIELFGSSSTTVGKGKQAKQEGGIWGWERLLHASDWAPRHQLAG